MSKLDRRFLAFAALASLALGASGHRRASADPLKAAATSDDADVAGQVWAQSRDDGDRLVVDVMFAASGRELQAVVIDADGGESSLGRRVVSEMGNATWSVDTALGGSLPCGVSSVYDLVGNEIVVRDATTPSTVLLTGTVPEPVSLVVDQQGREGIPRVAAPASAKAYVTVAHRSGHSARELFAVEVSGLDEDTTLDVWLEVPGSPGTLAVVGSITVDSSGKGEFVRSTNHGDDLPFDVAAAMDLVGLRLEVRTESGSVYFAGVVPAALPR